MNQLKEQHYIEQVLKGDSQAFGPLVQQYQNMVYGIGLNVLKDANKAEDLAQEVFVKAYQSLHKFKGDAKFSTWLYRIAYYAALDEHKKWKRRPQQSLENTAEGDLGKIEQKDNWEEDPKKRLIKNAMQLLPADQQTIIQLFYFDELSLKEIGSSLKMSEGNVKVKLHRARKKLYKVLEVHKESLITE